MYIEEVIRRAKKLCPSEYDSEEMYLWCDEVSAMLMIEDRNVFVKEKLKVDLHGKILLPDGVKFENVISVSANGRMLKKEDLRNTNPDAFSGSEVTIVYLKPYKPIRVLSYTGTVAIDKAASNITISDSRFKTGDSIRLTLEDMTYSLNILDVWLADDGYVLSVPEESVGDLDGEVYATIERVITDRTVCEAPYDSMYIDYIIAKICMYQRDFDIYNQFITTFNSRLNAYKRWITNQMPQAGGKLKNWW